MPSPVRVARQGQSSAIRRCASASSKFGVDAEFAAWLAADGDGGGFVQISRHKAMIRQQASATHMGSFRPFAGDHRVGASPQVTGRSPLKIDAAVPDAHAS
jgi:hypothetical protein